MNFDNDHDKPEGGGLGGPGGGGAGNFFGGGGFICWFLKIFINSNLAVIAAFKKVN